MILTGREAMRFAAQNKLPLHKYGDPTDEAREVTYAEGAEIAREDPGLLWCDTMNNEAIGLRKKLYECSWNEISRGRKILVCATDPMSAIQFATGFVRRYVIPAKYACKEVAYAQENIPAGVVGILR